MRKFNTTRGFAECGIKNFEFIVSERVQVNPDNSQAVERVKVVRTSKYGDVQEKFHFLENTRFTTLKHWLKTF